MKSYRAVSRYQQISQGGTEARPMTTGLTPGLRLAALVVVAALAGCGSTVATRPTSALGTSDGLGPGPSAVAGAPDALPDAALGTSNVAAGGNAATAPGAVPGAQSP